MGPGQEPNVGMFIDEHKKRADSDPNAPPFDDLRNYAYEGGGSTAGSLSSLASGMVDVWCSTISKLLIWVVLWGTGTDDEDQEYDQLRAWGPRFDKLSTMYGPEQNVVHDLEEL